MTFLIHGSLRKSRCKAQYGSEFSAKDAELLAQRCLNVRAASPRRHKTSQTALRIKTKFPRFGQSCRPRFQRKNVANEQEVGSNTPPTTQLRD